MNTIHPIYKTRGSYGMTLIELLTVIVIIMILASLVLAAIFATLRNARRSQAQVEVDLIATAIKAYQREYMRLPLQTSDATYDLLITNSMTAQLADLTGFLTTNNTTYNPQQIDFLKMPIPTNNILLDPWGTPYAIVLDLTGDGNIKAAAPEEMDKYLDTKWPASKITANGSVIVFSYGPDKQMNISKIPLYEQWEYKVTDNIFSAAR